MNTIKMQNKNFFVSIFVSILFILALSIAACEQAVQDGTIKEITNFDDCAKAGYAIYSSEPPLCETPDGRIFMKNRTINSFEDCVNAGYPVAGGIVPRVCKTPNGSTFIQKAEDEIAPPIRSTGCKNLCGDRICQEVICLAIGCPCAESSANCPQDCKYPDINPDKVPSELVSPCIIPSEKFYYYQNDTIELNISTDEFAVKFKENLTDSEIREIMQNYLTDEYNYKDAYKELYLFQLKACKDENEIANLIAKLNSDNTVKFVNPVFYYGSSSRMLLTNEFIVKLKPNVDIKELEALNQRYKVLLIEKMSYTNNQFVLKVARESQINALDMANTYHKELIVEWAEPNWIRKYEFE